MLRQVLFFSAFYVFFAASVSIVKPGPNYQPTKGEVWPRPHEQTKSETYFKLIPTTFTITEKGNKCDILKSAIERYMNILRNTYLIVERHSKNHLNDADTDDNYKGPLQELQINLSAPCETYPHLEMDENYEPVRVRQAPHSASPWLRPWHLTTNLNGYFFAVTMSLQHIARNIFNMAWPLLQVLLRFDDYMITPFTKLFGTPPQDSLNVSAVTTLNSDSIWGILRGLESFAQLFYMSDGYKNVLINTTQIVDFPKYTHRGLLIDTSRHYLSVSTILKTLDAMEINKMNVLHWHVVDDQSFPYQSEVFPQLSGAAYDPTMIYTAANINQIVNYARDRGIRVLPEFDMPGHTSSWGVAFPSILTTCYSYGQDIGLGPMDPTNNLTYKIISDLFREVQGRFPDKYFHVGGDEVELDCWSSNPMIAKFMAEHNMTHTSELHSYFMSKVIPLLGERSKPIVWQEVFDEGVSLPNGTIVQVWKNTEAREMRNILVAGHKVIYSPSWYLDHIGGGGDWFKYYGVDPRGIVAGSVPKSMESDILGGEACMWAEFVDDNNMISRVWPRASAVAEALWSGYNYENMYPDVWRYYRPSSTPKHELSCRLEEHVCRMNRRGIQAQPPNGPGFCIIQ